MEGADYPQLLAHLLTGTAVENNKLELAQLRKLPPKEQLEVSLVLREAMRQGEFPPEFRRERLARVRTVEEARRFLYGS